MFSLVNHFQMFKAGGVKGRKQENQSKASEKHQTLPNGLDITNIQSNKINIIQLMA